MAAAGCSLKRCGLEEKTVFLLESKKIRSSYDVLRLTPIDLVQLLDVPLAAARDIIRTVSSRLARKAERTTALHMKEAELKDPRSVKTGFETLDKALKGGLRAGTVTELVGPPGSCKSQFCIQVALFATLPRNLGGLDGKVLYFDAENHFRAERLVQMAQARFPERYLTLPLLKKLLRRVLVAPLPTLSHLESLLPNLEKAILEHDVRGIVIDNIALLAKTEYPPAETVKRQGVLGEVASHLKRVACAYRIPVVIVNQATSVREGSYGANGSDIGVMRVKARQGMDDCSAALGPKWAHYINTRISLVYKGAEGAGVLNLVKSPFAPEMTLAFTSAKGGLYEVGDEFDGRAVEGRGAELERHRGVLQYL
ncbi:Rad51-like DNA repair protein [Chloropicon primus]|uniref:Rad51-like DNA repair protein n=1 Tax=Chloropicon primus TaxID=1764295 RepID=A0A5B8MNE9_9CHLO|nr:Rad51-like DNA repair protein [Chloropicon primus]UPR00053.1 Rad51-like DNA repair protein [Chloropicon primus]|mmetsp:Transcript_10942/g.30763  ORF Transcript_10942/g.30763 Transcript_10942/m.30763 type:complete len:368 (+) Transcript_10942:205-1308(+)|eukprot:QDZ20840.1 Rad51-like DNA repair protein [Chloropicon primus]